MTLIWNILLNLFCRIALTATRGNFLLAELGGRCLHSLLKHLTRIYYPKQCYLSHCVSIQRQQPLITVNNEVTPDGYKCIYIHIYASKYGWAVNIKWNILWRLPANYCTLIIYVRIYLIYVCIYGGYRYILFGRTVHNTLQSRMLQTKHSNFPGTPVSAAVRTTGTYLLAARWFPLSLPSWRRRVLDPPTQSLTEGLWV
jgi:hypothetical protein